MPDVRLEGPLRITSRPRSAEGGGERRALIPRWQAVARLGSSGGRPNISLNPTRLSALLMKVSWPLLTHVLMSAGGLIRALGASL